MFFLAAGALVVLALAFTVWPLARARAPEASGVNRGALMRALYRDRVAELDAEAAAGQLEDETRAEVVDELGANLLEEYRAAESTSETAQPAPDERSSSPAPPEAPDERAPNEQSLSSARLRAPNERSSSSAPVRAPVWLLLVLLPVAAAGIYLSAGEPAAPGLRGATEVLRLDPRTDHERLESWRTRLARRVERRPDDGQSWYLLGVSRLQLGEFGAASEAFGEAHRELGSDPNINLYWLQARYLAAGGRMDERSRALADQILQARPNHPLVLEMFAIDAYRGSEFRAAVELLNRALNNPLPAGQRAALMGGLEEARSRMGTLTPTFDVSVTAPPDAPRQGTLFVIARPPGGGMPFAVVRRPAESLPMSVRLDDTVTMSGLKLSNAEAIEVVVRLSRSGTPAAAPGDWEWRSRVLHPGEHAEPVTLEATLSPWEGGAEGSAPGR